MRTLDTPGADVDSRMSIPETRLTAFSIGRVTVDSIVTGEAFVYATVTVTTGGANDGKSATGRRGAAKMPSTTIAAVSIATATRRLTAKRAIDMCAGGPRNTRYRGPVSMLARTYHFGTALGRPPLNAGN